MSSLLSSEKGLNKELIAEIDLDVFERLITGGEFSADDAKRFTAKVIAYFSSRIKKTKRLRSKLKRLDQSSWGCDTGHSQLNEMIEVILSISLEESKVHAEVSTLLKLS